MKATGFVVGPDEGPAGALKQLARQIGFSPVYTYRGIADAERHAPATSLVFFLFGAVDRLRRVSQAAKAIRTASSLRIRFAPMIYFSDSPSFDVIRDCIDMGFDDIITLPFTLRRVEERLQRQVDRPCAYYETPTYFGPDRRNRPGDAPHPDRGSGGQFRRIEIMRSLTGGVSIVSDESQIVL
jgi:hypothetical protein